MIVSVELTIDFPQIKLVFSSLDKDV